MTCYVCLLLFSHMKAKGQHVTVGTTVMQRQFFFSFIEKEQSDTYTTMARFIVLSFLFLFFYLFIYFIFFFLLFCLAEWRCATCTRMDDNKGIAGAAHFHFTTSLKEPWLSESRCSSSSSSFFFIGPNSLCPPLPANKFDGPHRARITVMTLGLQHLSSYVYTNHLP